MTDLERSFANLKTLRHDMARCREKCAEQGDVFKIHEFLDRLDYHEERYLFAIIDEHRLACAILDTGTHGTVENREAILVRLREVEAQTRVCA